MNRASLTLTYEGKDISADIASFVTSFSYVDHEGGKADDLQISLEDRKGLWKGSWFPAKGAILTAGIRSHFSGSTKSLHCGVFAIDEVSVEGPPDIVTLKAVSNFTAKALKREKKSKGWESISFQNLAAEIAGEHGLNFYYQVDEAVFYDRLDQREESDLAFLNRLCLDHDLNLKISGEKLIIFESRKIEQTQPVFALVRGDSAIGRYGFSTKTYDIYRACEVSYWDPEKKEEYTHTFVAPDAPSVGQTFKVNQRAESLADAIKKAETMLRRKNRQEITGSFDLMGDTVLFAGLTGTVSGWGIFDGKYIITEASHSQDRSQGYRANIKIRKVLNW